MVDEVKIARHHYLICNGGNIMEGSKPFSLTQAYVARAKSREVGKEGPIGFDREKYSQSRLKQKDTSIIEQASIDGIMNQTKELMIKREMARICSDQADCRQTTSVNLRAVDEPFEPNWTQRKDRYERYNCFPGQNRK